MSQSLGELGNDFSGGRLSLARRRRGLSKSDLAASAGVDARSISNYENGMTPRADVLRRLAHELGFPLSFFFGNSIEEIPSGAASFRSLARMTTSQRESALGQGALRMHFDRWLDDRFNMPATDVPDLRLESPEAAAATLRAMWGLGDKPIGNLIHLLESKGVRVYPLSVQGNEVDAFSLWSGEAAFVMLNVQKTAEHSRFDAAHELGHLALHKHGAPVGKEAESEANRFASSFLMPDADVKANTIRNPGIRAMIQWKARWKVSLAALNYRMHQLGMTSDHHYKTLCIQISAMGRTREPQPADREQSLRLNKIFQMLAEDGFSRSRVADELSITEVELESMLFRLTLTSVQGGRSKGETKPRPGHGLALVTN
jgi:Zn-dependent peptidase ImmA (M78 family)/DNA-binding XRE family transcriptional regulator